VTVRNLSSILESILADTLRLPAAAIQVRLLRSWEEIVGPLLSDKTAPGKVRNGVLTVFVRNHSWAQELQLSAPALLERIRAVAGEEKVREIRFFVDAASCLSGVPVTAAGERSPGEERNPSRGEEEADRDGISAHVPSGLEEVRDPETREILRSICRKSSRRKG
jgi:predicted nucleic acid-binding Zn ribbon protein